MAQGTSAPPRRTLHQILPWLGVVVGLWAVLPPYTGPELANLKSRVEVADHVVPGLVMLAVSIACLVSARRGDRAGAFPLVAGFTIALAGLWMTATHLPLVKQAQRGEAGVTEAAAAWHTTPGIVVLVLGTVWAAAHWSGAAADPPPTPTTRKPAKAARPK